MEKYMDKYLGRYVQDTYSFKVDGTFESLYAAQKWCSDNGYSYGSMSKPDPIAIVKGEYNLPEKWKNFDNIEKNIADGVIVSTDFREGEVKVIIF